MCTVTLAVRRIKDAHTSVNIRTLVTDVLDEFRLIPQCYVADNTANQVLANDLLADWSNELAAAAIERERNATDDADAADGENEDDFGDIVADEKFMNRVLS